MNIYGLIGYPLSHSFSKEYFTNKFKQLNINDSMYDLFPLKNISEFPLLLQKYPDIKGLNVTIPYKEEIIKYLDEIDELASKVGAVNTIKVYKLSDKNYKLQTTNYKLTGFNTDVFGFSQSLKPLIRDFQKNALILGTGGAAKAVAYVLSELNINYQFVSRNPSLNSETLNTISYSDLNRQIINSHHIIINATPLGKFPEINACPDIPYSFLTDKHLLYDLTYNPAETLFLKKGKEKHAMIQNGLLMLCLQADKAWEIWNNNQ